MNRVLIIYGAAPCTEADYAEAMKLAGVADLAGVGLDTSEVPLPFDWIVTLHPVEAQEIKARRAKAGLGEIIIVAHEKQNWKVDILEPYVPPTGSSALLGVGYGMRLGYKKIILCGCPLTGKNAGGYEYSRLRAGWEAQKDGIDGIVKSMSGWTKDFLGEPTKEWLDEG